MKLYGGAITINIPKRFDDISKFRQIPDHQEVYADANTDQSIIIEILSYQDNITNNNALQYYYDDLCGDNEAIESKILKKEIISLNNIGNLENIGKKYSAYAEYAITEQKIAKFKDEGKNIIRIYMFILRLPDIETDILLTYNAPIIFSETSSSHGRDILSIESNDQLFQQLISSFSIIDWSLFGVKSLTTVITTSTSLSDLENEPIPSLSISTSLTDLDDDDNDNNNNNNESKKKTSSISLLKTITLLSGGIVLLFYLFKKTNNHQKKKN